MSESHALIRRIAERLVSGTREPVAGIIVDDVWLAVVQGRLATGERLPSTRQVAVELGISPRSVEHAYRELEARGVVATRPGEGTFISLVPPSEEELERHRRFGELCRQSFERARELGFTVNDLLDALAEYRSLPDSDSEKET
ncbi:MAG: GntR family transcriptional regulator [Gemmatimonadota bacterium]